MSAELFKSVRGKGGGYVLGCPAEDITAGAAEGATAPVACKGLEGACGRAYLCSTVNLCSIVRFWTGRETVIDTYVDGVTLAELPRAPEIDLGM